MMAAQNEKRQCGALFFSLTVHPSQVHRDRLQSWCNDEDFQPNLINLLNSLPNVNNDAQLIELLSLAASTDFDYVYDTNGAFRLRIGLLLAVAKSKGWNFSSMVTPDSTPTNSPGGNGGTRRREDEDA